MLEVSASFISVLHYQCRKAYSGIVRRFRRFVWRLVNRRCDSLPLTYVQIHFCGYLVAFTKMIIHPIEKHLVIDSPVDLYYWYIPLLEVAMGKNGIAKLFRNGRSQAVRLPQEFRFEGDRVRIRRIDHGVILEPLIPDAAKWFDEMDRFNQEQFMGKRRNQPITPRREIFK